MSTFENEGQPGAVEPTESEATEDSWVGPSQEEWQQTQQTLQSLTPLAEMYQQYQAEGQVQDPYADFGQQQPPVQFDPFSDNAQDQIQQLVDQRIQEATAPLNDLYSQVQYDQLEEQARDILGDYKQANDIEFRLPSDYNGPSPDDLILAQADKLAPQMSEQYGPGLRAAEAAIQAATDAMVAYQNAAGQAYHEQQMNQLQTLGNAPRQPDTAGAASVQSLAAPTGGPRAVLEKYFPGS